MNKISGPRQFIILCLFALGGLGLFFSYKAYTKGSASQVEDFSFAETKDVEIELQDLKATLNWEDRLQESYQNIVTNNLFSPNREAWQPPEPKDKDKNKEKKTNTRRKRYNHDKVKLYGTSLSAKFKNALVYFGQFGNKRKYRLVNEKERIYEDKEQEQGNFFEVSSIKRESVVLVDPNGEEFTVGLYDHQRKIRRNKGSGKGQPSIQIEGQDKSAPDGESKQDKEEEAANPFKAMIDKLKERSQSDENNGEQKDSAAPQKQDSANGPDEKDKKEELVKQGKLRKIETPFGTIYRPTK